MPPSHCSALHVSTPCTVRRVYPTVAAGPRTRAVRRGRPARRRWSIRVSAHGALDARRRAARHRAPASAVASCCCRPGLAFPDDAEHCQPIRRRARRCRCCGAGRRTRQALHDAPCRRLWSQPLTNGASTHRAPPGDALRPGHRGGARPHRRRAARRAAGLRRGAPHLHRAVHRGGRARRPSCARRRGWPTHRWSSRT